MPPAEPMTLPAIPCFAPGEARRGQHANSSAPKCRRAPPQGLASLPVWAPPKSHDHKPPPDGSCPPLLLGSGGGAAAFALGGTTGGGFAATAVFFATLGGDGGVVTEGCATALASSSCALVSSATA